MICSLKFLSPEVVLISGCSTILPCIKYCCHVWAGAPSCYLELLDQLQNLMSTTVGPSLAASLELLAHCRNVASLSLFYGYYFGRCSSDLAQMVSLPYSQGRSTRFCIAYIIFLSPFLDVTRIFLSTALFLAQLNSGNLCL